MLPVDTKLYGIVARAYSKKAVSKVFHAKGRDADKSCIILITSFKEVKELGVVLSDVERLFLQDVWPGKVSVVLPQKTKKYAYLGRHGTLALRMVGKQHIALYRLLKKVGPLIAPSANPQGLPPAKTITEAKKYFGKEDSKGVSLYISGGKRNGLPSTLVKIEKGEIVVLRQGSVQVKTTS